MTHSSLSIALFFSLAVALSAQAGDPVENLATKPVSGKGLEQAVAPPQDASPWNFSAGYQYRQLGRLDWQTGSAAARSALPWLVGRPSNSESPGGASSTPPPGLGNHTYNDGFVNPDGGTPFDGSTGFWGYNNASQLQGSDLQFHASASSTSTVTDTTAGSSSALRHGGWSDELSGSGWFASMESPALLKYGSIRMSLELSYSYASDGSAHATGGVFTAEQHSASSSYTTSQNTNVVDHYDVTGLVVPTAPYAGSFAGPGPLINNAPTSREISTSQSNSPSQLTTQTAAFRSNVAENFDLRLHTVSLGPRFSGEWQRVRWGLGLGLGLNVADWSAGYQETLYARQNGGAAHVLRTWNATASDTSVLPGFYLETGVEVRLTQRLALFAGGRYDWAGALDQPVGPSHFHFDLGGWTVMGGLTLSF